MEYKKAQSQDKRNLYQRQANITNKRNHLGESQHKADDQKRDCGRKSVFHFKKCILPTSDIIPPNSPANVMVFMV